MPAWATTRASCAASRRLTRALSWVLVYRRTPFFAVMGSQEAGAVTDCGNGGQRWGGSGILAADPRLWPGMARLVAEGNRRANQCGPHRYADKHLGQLQDVAVLIE